MKKRLSLLILPLFIFSCGSQDEKPIDLASADTMTNLFLDIHLAEARIGRTVSHYDSSRMAYRNAHQELLQKYSLTDSAYRHSFDYYVNHPELMDKIYERVLDSLSLKEAQMAVTDSVTAAPPTDTATPLELQRAN